MFSNSFFKIFKFKSGFTLIELLVVIGIISILSITAVTVLNPVAQYQKANDSRRKSDLSQIQKALETYYQDNGQYPSNSASPDYKIVSGGVTINWGSSWQPYMSVLPKDPNQSRTYVYVSTGQTYWLYASIERGAQDPQSCNGGAACTNIPTGATCGNVCNYGVTSPNTSP